MLNLIIINIFFSFCFLYISNPLTIGIIIIIQTIIIRLLNYILITNSWYSFLLLIIYLRGVIVIFSYVSSLTTNKFYKINKIIILFILLILFILIILIIFISYFPILIYYVKSINYSYNIISLNEILRIYKIYHYSTAYITILIIIYLLITLIIIVKITNLTFGPLRFK